ncbi:adenosylcobinamide-phosphate synthase CbiB [Vagococcus fessus]
MMTSIIVLFLAFILDSILGDPYSWPHPVKVIGKSISIIDNGIQKNVKDKKLKYLFGIILWLIIVGGTGIVTYFLLKFATKVHPLFGGVIAVYLSYTTMAMKSLAYEGNKMYNVLSKGTLEEARSQIAMIVGRDTTNLTKKEITQATIETVAENTNDGMIAPLFYLALGGPVFGMMYKAVNTLDSMVGYKNNKHLEVGAASAILDDIFSFVPARVTWFLMIIVSFILRLDGKNALKIGWRDRYNHKSPNSAFPEAVVAGALGIQLGGTHTYHGIEIQKPTIGDPLKPVEFSDINQTNKLLYGSSILALLILIGFKLLLL